MAGTPNTNADAAEIDTVGTEEAQLLVNDPDDYHETQRLREIHEARRDVRTTLKDLSRFATDHEHNEQQMALADAVTFYISELEELMDATDYDDSLDKGPWDSLRRYATMMGRKSDGEIAGYEESMFVFREANKFLAEVKPLITEEEESEWTV
jgi:hypothetical protein